MGLPLQLAMKLAPVLRTPRAEVGLAFRHLDTGETWSHNDRRFPAGDLARLALAASCYRIAATQKLRLGEVVKAADCTVRDLLRRTLGGQDAEAPAQLAIHADLRLLNQQLTDWGLLLSHLGGPPGPAASYVTTPSEVAAVLARLAVEGGLLPEHHHEALAFMRLRSLPQALRKLQAADPAHLEAIGASFRHLAYVKPGPGGYLLAILSEGRIGLAALSKVVATVDAHYADAHLSQRRVLATLEARRAVVAPDPRTDVWDIRPTWRDGKLHLVGHVSASQWPEVVEACRAASGTPVVDGVQYLTGTPPWAIALAPVIHLRKEPGHAAELIGQAPMGTVMAVLEAGEEWWHVRNADGQLAWARSSNLQPATDRDAERWRFRDQVLITAPLIKVPRLTHGAVTLSAGTRLALVGRRKDGMLGRTPGREEVLVPESACRFQPLQRPLAEPTAQEIIRLAEPFMGVPYLWGGTTGWGLDCSGLTQLVYGMAGIRIPRDSDQQLAMARAIHPIDHINQLRTGDLVFFKGHVGLFAGRGEFIHASAPAGCVTVNSLLPGPQHYASSLVKRFLGGGRILGQAAPIAIPPD